VRFVSIRDLRGRSAEIWRELPAAREMIITSNGRPVAILAAVNESNLESTLAAFRQARATNAVASLQGQSAARAGEPLTTQDIESEIVAVREAHLQ